MVRLVEFVELVWLVQFAGLKNNVGFCVMGIKLRNWGVLYVVPSVKVLVPHIVSLGAILSFAKVVADGW
jgi:hypothetical protein